MGSKLRKGNRMLKPRQPSDARSCLARKTKGDSGKLKPRQPSDARSCRGYSVSRTYRGHTVPRTYLYWLHRLTHISGAQGPTHVWGAHGPTSNTMSSLCFMTTFARSTQRTRSMCSFERPLVNIIILLILFQPG